MSSDAEDVRPPSSNPEASRKILQRQCVGIAANLWREYGHPPQSTSRVQGSMRQTRGIDGFQVGDRVLSLQSCESDSTHHWERTLL